MDVDPIHDTISFVLFTVCAALVAVLVWVLLRRMRRVRQMRDQETMTAGEPSAKLPSTADSVSAAGVSRKDSAVQTSPDRVLQAPAGIAEGRTSTAPPAAKTIPAAGAETVSSPPGGAATEGIAETKAESKSAAKAEPDKKGRAADGATSKPSDTTPADSSQLSGLKKKSKRRRSSINKSATEGGSKPPSRRDSLQRSLISTAKSASSSERPAVPALLIRRPSTDSRSSQRSNRSTRYVGEVPKVEPALDIFSREHSSMVESPPSNLTQSPPPATGSSMSSPGPVAKPES
ncbi:uncharacterized protein LOC144100841 [Amblyomma americanum]